MDTLRLPHHRQHLYPFVGGMVAGSIILFFIVSFALAASFLTPRHRIVRGVSIAGTPVSGLTKNEALARVSAAHPQPSEGLLSVQDGERLWATNSASLGLRTTAPEAVESALALGKNGPPTRWLAERAWLLATPRNLPLSTTLDPEATRHWVTMVAQELDSSGRRPSVAWNGSAAVIDRGEAGRVLQRETLIAELLATPQTESPHTAPVEIVHVPLSADGLVASEARVQRLAAVRLALKRTVDDAEPSILLGPETFMPWLTLPAGYDQAAVQGWAQEIASSFSQPAQDAQWEMAEDGKTLKVFQPEQAGTQLSVDTLVSTITEQLSQSERAEAPPTEPIAMVLPIEPLLPSVRLRDLNSLGIVEQIGEGNSTFFHSIPNRVHNVTITSERVHATLVQPGEEFSFNRSVGDISAQTGYKTAYVIRNGRTELGDGGGVCQVSTTVFRAALNAGFPITAWKAHSYRVGYYEQNQEPGFDATVYSPSTDLRFRNDSEHPIVVASFVDPKNYTLRVEIWGTGDGRTATISDYKIYNQRPAPAALYTPDPSLAPGAQKQIDWSAPGATTKFHYQVKNSDGSVRFERDFTSVFKPWQAVFLVGPTI